MKLFSSRLARRLFTSVLGVSFAVAVLVGLWFEHVYRERVIADIRQNLSAASALLTSEFRSGLFQEHPERLASMVTEFGQASAYRITIIAPDGSVRADSSELPDKMENHLNRPEVREAIDSGTGSAERFSATLHMNMLYFAQAIRTDAALQAVIRVAVPKARVTKGLAPARRALFWSLFASLILALLLSAWLTDSVADPLVEMGKTVSAIRRGDLKARIWNRPPDDFGDLASAINDMAAELERRTASTEEATEKLDLALSALHGGMITVDAHNRLLYWNDSATRLLDWLDPPKQGVAVEELLRISPVLEMVGHVRKTGSPMSREISLFRKDGERTIQAHGSTCAVLGGSGVIVVFHDVTELRFLERARQDFVGNASHELKTPLAVIKGYADTLREVGVEDEATRRLFLDQLSANVDRLATLADDLLALSRIESGRRTPDLRLVDGRMLVADAVERFRPGAEKKSLTLAANIPAEEVRFTTDPASLGEILDNLLDNAVKYTPKGGKVVVRLRMIHGGVAIDVEDTGVGIPKGDQERIFERFYRVDKARSIEAGGTGLGLSIAKHLATQLNGSIAVASEVGRGSRFTVSLPLS
ncbi:MAG: ATP-binding protein [Pseudomonadota bacterium]